jgi:cytochrome c oxidase subunit III
MNNLEGMTAQEHKARTARSYKLLLLVSMVSMIMIFAGLTSAFVVSKSREDWLKDFQLPSCFFWSTAVILLSSLTLHLAKLSIKKDDKKATTVYLAITLVLGILFAVLQKTGFDQLFAMQLFPVGGTGAITISFLYVFVYTHLAHLLGGLIALIVVFYKHLKSKYNASNYLGIELAAMFWHFLDALWIYLFFFLYFFK